jgi:methionyl-tRNA formyltransferase
VYSPIAKALIMRTIFMGTPEFAVPTLRTLLGSTHQLVGVYTQPPRPAGRGMRLTPSPVHQIAQARGIPVFTPTSLKSPEAQAEMAALNADIAVVAAYGLLLPQAVLDIPRLGCVNLHPSDLPRWRGAAPIQRTIMAGDTHTACCIMQMNAGLDTGDILAREPVLLPASITTGELHDLMANLGARMLLETLDKLTSGALAATPQSEHGASYAKKITKADQWLDWNQPAAYIVQKVRGLSPTPGSLTEIHGETVKIFDATLLETSTHLAPGTCINDQLHVATGDGNVIAISRFTRPGKPITTAAEALRNWAVPAGTALGFPPALP